MGRGGAAGAFNLSGAVQPAEAGQAADYRKMGKVGTVQAIISALGGNGAIGSTPGTQPLSSSVISQLNR